MDLHSLSSSKLTFLDKSRECSYIAEENERAGRDGSGDKGLQKFVGL